MRRPWLNSLFAGRRPARRPALRPDLVRLEDRTTPSTITLDGAGNLEFFGADVNNTLTVSFDGANVTFEDAADPATAIPAGFTDVNADGSKITGPIAGVNTLKVHFGNQTGTLNVGSFATNFGNVSLFADTTGASFFNLTAGGFGLVTTGDVNVSNFQQVNVNNQLSAGGIGVTAQIVSVTQPVQSFNLLSLQGDQKIVTFAPLQAQGSDVSLTGAIVQIGGNVTAAGDLTILPIDTAAGNENLTVAPGLTIATSAGNAFLFGADGLFLGTGSVVQASGSISLGIGKAGDLEPGFANLTGADLIAPGGATLLAGDGVDTVTVSGTTTPFTVDGRDANGTDVFTFDAQGTTPVTTQSTAKTPGKAVTTFVRPNKFTLVNAAGQTVDGGAGDDAFVLRVVNGIKQFSTDNGVTFTPVSGNSIRFNGNAGKDTLSVEYVNGDPVPTGGVTFDGTDKNGDTLFVRGSGSQVVTYLPDKTTKGNGVVVVDNQNITFQNLTPVVVDGVASFTVLLPNGDDVVTVGDDPVVTALLITGTSGGVGFEDVTLSNTGRLTIDTRSVAGKDTVTLASTIQTHGVQNLTVVTGLESQDKVLVQGNNLFAGTAGSAVTTGGKVDVTGKLTTGGAVSLVTTDSVVSQQDIHVFATGRIISTAGAVTLSAGDDLRVDSGGAVIADTLLSLSVDTGGNGGTLSATGGTANLIGAVLAGTSGSLNGNGGDDKFSVSGYNAPLIVNGKAGSDTLNFDGAGVDLISVDDSIRRTAGPNQAVTAIAIEKLAISNALSVSFSGTAAYSESIDVTANTVVAADGTTFTTGKMSVSTTNGFTGGDSTTGKQVTVTATTFDVSGAFKAALGTTTSITTTGAANFNSTVDGPGSLGVAADGDITFAKDVGGTTAVNSLTVSGKGTTNLQGSKVFAVLSQSYGNNVVVSAPTVAFKVTAPVSSGVSFSGTLDGKVADATAATFDSTSTVSFSGNVGQTGRLSQIVTNAGTAFVDLPGGTGISINTKADQIYNDTKGTFGILAGINTKFTSEVGPIQFNGLLDAPPFGVGISNLVINAGSGPVLFGGDVGSKTPFQTVTVSGSNIKANGSLKALGRADFQVGGGTLAVAGPISAAGLGLAGSGIFTLTNPGNDVGDLGLRVHIGTGSVAVADKNTIRIDNSSVPINGNPTLTNTSGGITAAGGNVNLFYGTRFEASDASGNNFVVPMIDLGTGNFRAETIVPPVDIRASVVFNIEVIANSVTLGRPGIGDAALQYDTFAVRPSANVQINVNGNQPTLANLAPGFAGDTLSVLAGGATNVKVVPAAAAGDGSVTFGNRKDIVFTSIEGFGGLQTEGFVVQVTDSLGGNRSYAIRYSLTFPGSPDSSVKFEGQGLPGNSFVVTPARRDSSGPFNSPQVAIGDVNNDGIPDLVIANGQDDALLVTVVNGVTALQPNANLNLSALGKNDILAQFYPYEPTFMGGLSLAVADLDGDGFAEIITGAGVGGGPLVKVFSYNKSVSDPLRTIDPANPRANFFAYESTFRGGVTVAAGDVTGDGKPDLVLGTGFGGGPRVRVLDGTLVADGMTYKNLNPNPDQTPTNLGPSVKDFFAFESTLRGGVFVAAADVDDVIDKTGNRHAEVVVGAGFGGAPRVRAFRGSDMVDPAVVIDPLNYISPLDFFALPDTSGTFSGDSFRSGVGGIAFGKFLPNSITQRTLLVASPRGLDAQALSYSYTFDPTTMAVTNLVATDLTLTPDFQPGGSFQIIPDVNTLRDAVAVFGFSGTF